MNKEYMICATTLLIEIVFLTRGQSQNKSPKIQLKLDLCKVSDNDDQIYLLGNYGKVDIKLVLIVVRGTIEFLSNILLKSD